MTTPNPAGETVHLLTASDIRALASRLGIRPTKTLGQNFVTDGGTVRRIVRTAGVTPSDTVLEVGPGLGSLTLGLLETGARVIAVEIDPTLARALPGTVAEHAPVAAQRLTVVTADAMQVTELPAVPTRLVANLPYNVAVPVLLHLLERFESLTEVLVMVQAEVADRLVAGPGSRTYGIPSAKAAWYAAATRAGSIGRTVFWPVPNVDSALVRMVRRDPPAVAVSRVATFACIDAAFSQRRKTLRSALSGWAGSATLAEQTLREAGVDPRTRGERLDIAQFAAVAAARGAVREAER
ncbi:16S rRNA (adenine(1518)-N(6)/adenine(1519)-N(6))-dimethyltransferase RsmA [Ruania alkalisoli]|uniref:Ribosomal RNA small subunit methyltransferase A n=1 Tax=Ruania alkalisoli TaxID=2779775 RepID=A0A7M1SVU8_9MICO|nr:16S rRNA (adenine(1518)-N(6)/adenine(1519)-N(6))-dimethyltransferase RsmA [Ruania alkalisoli]QOR71655.1 16S rRNA (adenine(1518)-N(6)/adenine(1519)-N(6))-dimethyltransferase RsmA [Ruania alkalisoli]